MPTARFSEMSSCSAQTCGSKKSLSAATGVASLWFSRQPTPRYLRGAGACQKFMFRSAKVPPVVGDRVLCLTLNRWPGQGTRESLCPSASPGCCAFIDKGEGVLLMIPVIMRSLAPFRLRRYNPPAEAFCATGLGDVQCVSRVCLSPNHHVVYRHLLASVHVQNPAIA